MGPQVEGPFFSWKAVSALTTYRKSKSSCVSCMPCLQLRELSNRPIYSAAMGTKCSLLAWKLLCKFWNWERKWPKLAVVRQPLTTFNLCSNRSARDSFPSKKPSPCFPTKQFINQSYSSSLRLPSRQEKACTENLRMYLLLCFMNCSANYRKYSWRLSRMASQQHSISTQRVSNRFLKKSLSKQDLQVVAAALASAFRPVCSQRERLAPRESRMAACRSSQVSSRCRLPQRRVQIFSKLQRTICLPMDNFFISQTAIWTLPCTLAKYSPILVSQSQLLMAVSSFILLPSSWAFLGRRVSARGLKVLACSDGFWQRCRWSTSFSRKAWKAEGVLFFLPSSRIFQKSSAESYLSCRRGWITLGINNGLLQWGDNNHLNYMQQGRPAEVEVGIEQGYSRQKREERTAMQIEWQVEQRAYFLGKAFRIAGKYYSRCFMTSFKSYVLQRLLQQHTAVTSQNPHPRPSQKEADWPYRSLLLKPNKSQHQLLQIEFISMCAQKIQAVFKGYLQRKRFRIAFGRLRRFTRLLGAFVKGWKVRAVMRCLKVQEEMRSLTLKRTEVQKEMMNTGTNGLGSRFGQRRLDYLKASLQAETEHFQRRFNELYNEGAWVFQPRVPFPSFKRVQKWSERKHVSPLKENAYTQQLQTVQFVPETQPEPKKKRVREMRDNSKRGRNVQQNTEVEQNKDEAARVDQRGGDGKWSQASTMANTGEDRPIQAKGAYLYAPQEELGGTLQEAPSFPTEGENPNEQNQQRKAQARKAQKKKMQKRKMYDPRKAIEQQKRRKKQQQQNKQQPQSQTSIPTVKQRPKEPPKEPSVIESKSQRVIKMQKQDHSRSTVNLPRNKPKVQAKIDCWGNRKTVAKKQPTPQDFIKAVVPPHPETDPESDNNDYRQEPTVAQRLAAKMNERRGKGKERLEYSEQREKARIQMYKNCEQSQRIKQAMQRQKQQQAREAQATKHLKAQALRQQRAAQDQKQKRKELVYRSVEELTETYKNQYLTRFQNLYPKLSLLLAARTSEQHSRIPVLTLDSDYVQRMMEENRLNQRFWYTVSKMERRFKDFVKG